MALQDLSLFWKKWFEYYNIEFGTYDGTFVLYSKNIWIENNLLKILNCICLLKGLTDVSDCFHVSGSLRSRFWNFYYE